MHKDPLQRQLAELPTVAQLRAVQRRNQVAVQSRGAPDLSRLSLAAVWTAVAEGKRPRSPEQTQGERSVDDVIARARYLVDAQKDTEGQLPEDDLEEALEALQELRDVPADRQDEVKRLIEELEDALRPAVPLPSPPRASQATRLAVQSALLRARQLLSQLRPAERVDSLSDDEIRELVRQLEGQRERLASVQVVGDADLASEVEKVDLMLREAIYSLESFADNRSSREPEPGPSAMQETPGVIELEQLGDEQQAGGDQDGDDGVAVEPEDPRLSDAARAVQAAVASLELMLQRFTESDTVSSDDNPDNLLEQAMAAINEARRVVAGDVDAAALNRELDELEAELRAAHAQAAVAQR